MKRIFVSGFVALGLCLATGGALAGTVTLPKVTVVGTTIDGVRLGCTGSACGNYMMSVGGIDVNSPLTPVAGMGESGGGGLEVTKLQFCNQLASQRPKGCNPLSPPSVPVYDPMWEPNGCGTGWMANLVLEKLVGGLYSEHFSGNLDTPVHVSSGPDISFFAACNEHDKCWGSGSPRGGCDGDFYDAIRSQCSGLVGADLSACYGIAATYYGGVASDFATEHYDESVNNYRCAVWAYDMRRNGCV